VFWSRVNCFVAYRDVRCQGLQVPRGALSPLNPPRSKSSLYVLLNRTHNSSELNQSKYIQLPKCTTAQLSAMHSTHYYGHASHSLLQSCIPLITTVMHSTHYYGHAFHLTDPAPLTTYHCLLSLFRLRSRHIDLMHPRMWRPPPATNSWGISRKWPSSAEWKSPQTPCTNKNWYGTTLNYWPSRLLTTFFLFLCFSDPRFLASLQWPRSRRQWIWVSPHPWRLRHRRLPNPRLHGTPANLPISSLPFSSFPFPSLLISSLLISSLLYSILDTNLSSYYSLLLAFSFAKLCLFRFPVVLAVLFAV